jgi:hypothetical protein
MWKNIGERQEEFFNYFYRSRNKDKQSFKECAIQIPTIRMENDHRSRNAILLRDTLKLQLHEHS